MVGFSHEGRFRTFSTPKAGLRRRISLAAALLDHNDLRNFAPSEQHTKEVQHVYESARRSRLCYAAWLTPFDLHVTPTVSMRCQQCYARDPHAATTAFAVCGAFVPRAAAPPRRFFAEPAP